MAIKVGWNSKKTVKHGKFLGRGFVGDGTLVAKNYQIKGIPAYQALQRSLAVGLVQGGMGEQEVLG